MATRAPALPPDERRAAIVAATLPLLLERGPNLSTRQIAEAAGVAEGTIFGVFPDKDAVVQAVVDAALDPAPTERALAAIDPSLPLEAQLVEAVEIMQDRMNNIWRVLANAGNATTPQAPPPDLAALVEIFERGGREVRTAPLEAQRLLRAMTLAVSHPMFYASGPMSPREIVTLFLEGIRVPGGEQARKAAGR
jgi:AcrR family transcriptional regulator